MTLQPRSSLFKIVCGVAGLVLLAAAVYWPVHGFGFLPYDDQTYVRMNSYVQTGWSRDAIHYAFTASFGGWAPLVWISFLVDRQLFGAAPGWMHVENAAWHAVGGLVLWLLLALTTRSPARSWLVAALFIVHPMHVESVAWVSERKDVLSTPLLLGSLAAYWQYSMSITVRGRLLAYVLMLVLLVLSLMTKAMGVSTPLLMLLLDYWPMGRWRLFKVATCLKLVAQKIPVFIIAGSFCIVAITMQRASGATNAAAALPLIDRANNAIVCYVIYIAKLLIPIHLAAFYPHPGSRPAGAVVAAASLIALITWLAVRHHGAMPYLLMGWLWFVIALLPVIGLIQVGGQAMADRYSYLPSIGLFIAAVWGAGDLLGRLSTAAHAKNYRWISPALAFAVIAFMTLTARSQVWYWKDNETLFRHSYEVTGPNPVASFALGVAAQQHGDQQTAVEHFTEVVGQDPGNDRAFKFLGDLLVSDDLEDAIKCYQQSVTLKPGKVDYHIALAAALTRLNDNYSLRTAAEQLRQVLQIDPENLQAKAGLLDLADRRRRLIQGNKN